MSEHKTQSQIYSRFSAERFVEFMVSLHDWSVNHNCEIGVETHKNTVVVTFTNGEKRIKHSFDRRTLSICGEMLVWEALKSAFEELKGIVE